MNEYEEKAEIFLKEAETKMTIWRCGTVNGFPFGAKDRYPHFKYKITLKRQGKQYTFSFYDCYDNYLSDGRPSKYDVLSTLVSFPVDEDVNDFASAFGYSMDDLDSRQRTKKTHKACLEQYRRLHDLFGDELMDKLAEIQ